MKLTFQNKNKKKQNKNQKKLSLLLKKNPDKKVYKNNDFPHTNRFETKCNTYMMVISSNA